MNTEDLQKLDRQHVIYSWKQQGGWLPTVIDHAEGIYMYDNDGRRIVDGCAGLLNINLGHGNRYVLDAMKAQMEKLCFVSPGFATEPKARLASMVAEVTPGDLEELSRRHRGRHNGNGRPTSLARRARHLRGRAFLRALSV